MRNNKTYRYDKMKKTTLHKLKNSPKKTKAVVHSKSKSTSVKTKSFPLTKITGRKKQEKKLTKQVLDALADAEVARSQLEQNVNERTEALQEREKRLSSIYNTVGDVIYHVAVEAEGRYRFLSVNKAFVTTTGIPYDHLVGKFVDEVIPQPSLSFVLEKYKEAIRDKKIVRWEETSNYPTGTLTGVVSVAPVFDDETGKCTHLVGAVHDITERKKLELSLIKQAAILDKAQIIAKMGFLDWNLKTNEIFLSDGIYPLYGLPSLPKLTTPDFVGKVVHPDDMAYVQENLQLAIKGVKPYDIEHRIILPDGGVRWMHAQAEMTYDDEGNPANLLGTVIDITNAKLAENEIHKLNAELEQRVRERTVQLTSANKELESFSYSVSHDLRAPLRAIKGFSEIIARRHKEKLNEEGQHYINNIIQASNRMERLIDDMLVYSRIGKSALRNESIKMDELLRSLLQTFTEQLEKNGGDISLAKDFPKILADQSLVIQVFTNLIENALKFKRPGVTPQIKIDWQIDGSFAIFQISDNGIGIASEHYERIFQIFQRLHNEDEFPGTGIGLATVKKSLVLLGGSISVTSEIGRGSVFSVRLPMP